MQVQFSCAGTWCVLPVLLFWLVTSKRSTSTLSPSREPYIVTVFILWFYYLEYWVYYYELTRSCLMAFFIPVNVFTKPTFLWSSNIFRPSQSIMQNPLRIRCSCHSCSQHLFLYFEILPVVLLIWIRLWQLVSLLSVSSCWYQTLLTQLQSLCCSRLFCVSTFESTGRIIRNLVNWIDARVLLRWALHSRLRGLGSGWKNSWLLAVLIPSVY